MAEGDFPKSPGDVLHASEFNAAVNLHVGAIKAKLHSYANGNTTQYPWDTNHEYLFADILSSASTASTSTNLNFARKGYYTDTAVTATYESTKHEQENNISKALVYATYDFMNLLDNFEDDSISGDWTTATSTAKGIVRETGGYIECEADDDSGNGSKATAYYNAVNYYQTTKKASFYIETKRNTSNPANKVFVQITDGSTNVTLKEYNNVVEEHVFEVYFNGTDDTCSVYIDGVLNSTPSLSGLTSNWYIQIKADPDASSQTCSIRMYYLADNNLPSPSSTFTMKVSADDGSTYDTGTAGNKDLITLTTPGTDMKIGFDAVVASGELLRLYNIGAQYLE